MKIITYIDGYNFFYGRLSKTQFKWLDLYCLFSNHIIPAKLPASPGIPPELVQIKYFTSPVKRGFSTSENVQANQHAYLNALKKENKGKTSIYEGKFQASKIRAYSAESNPVEQAEPTERVWKLEEKITDVNIAMHMYRDVAKGLVDHILLCSNDSDLLPAIDAIKEDFPNITIGLIVPTKKENGRLTRPPSKDLANRVDWVMPYIPDAYLENSQMPDQVKAKKIYTKPAEW